MSHVRVLGIDGGVQDSGFTVVDHVHDSKGVRAKLVAGFHSYQPPTPKPRRGRAITDGHRRRRNHAERLVEVVTRFEPTVMVVEGYQSFQREIRTAKGPQRRTVSSDKAAMIVGVFVGVGVTLGLETVEVMPAELSMLLLGRRVAMGKEQRIRLACQQVEGATAAIWRDRPSGWRHIGDGLTHALIWPRVRDRNLVEAGKHPTQLGLGIHS